jgi:hypothetical protein
LVASHQVALICTVAIEWGRQRWSALERLIGPALRQCKDSKPTSGTWSMLGILISLLDFRKELAIPAMLHAQLGTGHRWTRMDTN